MADAGVPRGVVLQRLREAGALLIEKGWTRGTYARDADGRRTLTSADDAVSFCALGAVERVTRPRAEEGKAVVDALGGGGVVLALNDFIAKDVGDVLAMFDQAIAKLEVQS